MKIAERAGVSIATVSRALNGVGARPDTVARVRQAAEELGYAPNAVARSLKGGRTRQITFAMPDIGNPVYVTMVREIQSAARAAGYRLLLHSTDAIVEDELAVIQSLAERTSDGLILCPIRITPGHVAALAQAAGPVVVIGSVPPEAAVDSIGADSVTGAQAAVRHLAETGRRKIAFVNGPVDTVPGRNRDEGYRTALAECQIAYDPALSTATVFSIRAGAVATRRLLAERPDIDAVFCANDQLALGALHALHALGRRIPEDVAVVGMDNTVLAQAAWPPLTSVDLGSATRGRQAAELLLERLADPAAPAPRRTAVAPELVLRASSAQVTTEPAEQHAGRPA